MVGSAFSNNDNGEAFVYTKSGSTYVRTQKLTASRVERSAATPPPPAFLGDNTAISSDGSTIVFGEPNVGVTDVFTKPAGASAWKQTARLPGGGDSVAVSGKGTIVAAGQTGLNNLNGEVFVFTKSGGTFTEASTCFRPRTRQMRPSAPAQTSACPPTAPSSRSAPPPQTRARSVRRARSSSQSRPTAPGR